MRVGGADPLSRIRFLESILESVNDAVITTRGAPLDEPGPQIVYMNAAFSRMTGYAPEDILGKTPRVLQGPETDRAELDRIRESLSRGESVKAEVLNYRKDGSVFWVELDIFPVPGEGDWPEYWVSAQRETTGRREAEKTLRAVLAQHELEMITILEPDGTPRYESPAVERILGYRHEDSVDGDFFRHVHPEDAQRLSGAVAECLSTPGEHPPVEYRIRHADGFWRWFESVGENLADQPEVGGVVVRTRDITARKESEEALQGNERRFRSLIGNLSEVVKVVDLDGTLRYASPAMKRVLGYEPEEMLGENVLDYIHPEDLPLVLEETRKAVEQPGVVRNAAEYRTRHADGSWRHVEVSGTYLMDDPAVNGVLVNVRDVTPRKEAEQRLRDAEARYRSLVEQVPGITYIEDAETGATLYDSPQIEEVLGYSRDISRKDPHYWWKIVHPDDLERVRQEQSRAGEKGKFSLEYRVFAEDGRTVWLRDEAAVVKDGAEGSGFWRGFLFDITERKQAEQRLEESEERLASVTSGAPVILFALDREGRLTLAEGKGLETLGLAPGEHTGCSVFEKWRTLPDMMENLRRALSGEEVAATVEIEDFTFDARYSPVKSGGEVSGVIGVATDITERRKLEKELEHRAFHDPLTGLANRSLCMDRLSQSLKRADRRGASAALLFMDLDDFKLVNDSLGHDTGDELLIEVAERLRQCLRPGDTLARLGGDEFVVLLEDTGLDGAIRVADRVAELLRPPFPLGEKRHERFVTASIGVTVSASSDGNDRRAEDLLREADLAMYRAKEEGKGHYEVFDSEMSVRILGRLKLEDNLRRALEQDQLEIHYQPVVSLESGKTVGLEALVRWRCPERGLVYPADFIPLAEETGLIIPLGRRVLEESCRRLKEWQLTLVEGDPIFLCVNLSTRQFRHPGLACDVAEILKDTGVSPETVYLEVTESVAMAGAPETDALDELKQLGVGVMIDDFGTGHSSLSYLKNLPLDCIKIDRAFASGLGGDLVDQEIVAAIVRLGHAVNLKVVAEGVESAEQLLRLRELGCDYAQGYFFSEPLPAGEITELLKTASLW